MRQESNAIQQPRREKDSRTILSTEQRENRGVLRVITVGGGKGGIGKSVVCASLAIALTETGARVVLVDADLGGANLHTVMGSYLPAKTLHDFISRQAKSLDEVAIPTPIERLRIVCGAPGVVGFAHIEYWEKQKMIRHLRKLDADFVIVDIGAGMSFNESDLFNAGDVPIAVANPEPTSIQECYNFLKVAIFRRLRQEFAESPLVLELLDRCKDPSHANDRRLLAEIGNEILQKDRREGMRFFKTLNAFTPKLILNRVFDSQETRDGLALQIAAQDLLSIRLDYWGYMSYDPQIAKVIRESRLQDILGADSPNRQRFMAMVRKHLLGENIHYRSPGARVILPIIEKSNHSKEARICSTQCSLWGNCELQQGGLPCRVPDEVYQQRVGALGKREKEEFFPEVEL
jgi:flagellar biosynthesis protein FlhG